MAVLIFRTMDDPEHDWPYKEAVRCLTKTRYRGPWEFHMGSHISRASKELIKERPPSKSRPIEAHMVLKLLNRPDYILVRKSSVTGYDGDFTFHIEFGGFLYVEPSAYRTAVERLDDSWLGNGRMKRQMAHLGDEEYERTIRRIGVKGLKAKRDILRIV